MSITRASIRAEMAKMTGLGETGTSDSGTTATLVDAGLASYAEDWPEGSIIMPTAGDEAGEPRWVTAFARATGEFTVSPVWTTGPGTDAFEVWKPEVGTITNINEAIDRALTRRCWYWALVPLGILADGDCQSTTGWSETNITSNTATAVAYPYRFGRYKFAMIVSANNGTISQSLSVAGAKTYHLAVLMRPGSVGASTTSIDVVDITAGGGGTAIATSGDTLSVAATATATAQWLLYRAQFTTPADCTILTVKFKNSASGETSWLGFFALWPSEARSLPVPDRVTSEGQIGHIYRWRRMADPETPESWKQEWYIYAEPTRSGLGGLEIAFGGSVGSDLFLYDEQTMYEVLSADSGTTDCPDEYVATMASFELLASIAEKKALAMSPDAEAWAAKAGRMASRANKVAEGAIGPLGIVVRNRRT